MKLQKQTNKKTLKLFQTYMNFFLPLNTNYDILKNMDNKTVVGHH